MQLIVDKFYIRFVEWASSKNVPIEVKDGEEWKPYNKKRFDWKREVYRVEPKVKDYYYKLYMRG